MHVLQINTEKGWRGGERQTLLSMEGLRDAGVTVTLLCLRDRPLAHRARQAGFAVVGVTNQAGALWHLISHGRRYSVLHAQSSRAFGFAAIASLLVPVPLVYTRRVDFVPGGAFTRWKYRRASKLVAISKAIAVILRDAGMGEAEVISSIVSDHRADPARQKALSDELHPGNGPIVGVVGALVPHKDPLTMIGAAAVVRGKMPGVRFLHFGEGDLRDEALTRIDGLNLSGSYHLLGHRSGVEDYFPLFSCFAMSSKEEGLGSSVLDAFNNGIPVASTAAGGLTELVEGRGLLSPPEDAAALGENIIRLLTDKPLALSLAAAAKTYVTTCHDRAVLTRRYITVYEKLTGAHP
jgi:glycosyltransferase involved in cell wall biosynthesis